MKGFSVRLAVVGLALTCGGVEAMAQAPAPASPQQEKELPPITPGGARITVRNPLQGNWICKGTSCQCKPLACAAESVVRYTTAPTPARRPNQQALEKFAAVEIPKRFEAMNAATSIMSDGKRKVEMLASAVSKYLGYSAVLSEARVSTEATNATKTVFITTAYIFAGPVLLSVQSISPDRTVAMDSLNTFINAMTVEEGPPGPAPRPGAPPRPPSPRDPKTQVDRI